MLHSDRCIRMFGSGEGILTPTLSLLRGSPRPLGLHHHNGRASIERSTVRYTALWRSRPSVCPRAITLTHGTPLRGASRELRYIVGVADGRRPRRPSTRSAAVRYGLHLHGIAINGAGTRYLT